MSGPVGRGPADRVPVDRGEPVEPDDRSLLAAHVAGDPEAFGRLFARHRDRLWAVALRTTGDREEAADALQDAMVAAFRRAESFRGDAAVTTWLHRVVVNACLDRLRRSKVRATEPLPDDHDDLPAIGSTGPPSGTDPVDAAERAERRRAVVAALGQVSPEQRAALVLVDMEGYSVEEAAAILEVPAGTVKSRCSRGRARLAPLLAAATGPAGSGHAGSGHAGGEPTSGEPTSGEPTSRGNRERGSRVGPVGPPDQGRTPGGGTP